MKNFFKNEDGLVTIEWVGIAAVMVIAAIAIAAGVMGAADKTGKAISDKNTAVSSAVTASSASSPGSYGNYQ